MKSIRLICGALAISVGLSPLAAIAEPIVGVGGTAYYLRPGTFAYVPTAGVSDDGSSLVFSAMGGPLGLRGELWRDLQGPTLLADSSSGFRLNFATGISGDGHTAVGLADATSASGQFGAAIWRDTGEVIRMGVLAGPEYPSANSIAWAASYDGSVVVGDSTGVDGVAVATIWTPESGLQALPFDPGARNPGNTRATSVAADVSGDGQTVVGTYGAEAFIWNSATGTTVLGGGPISNEWIQNAVAISSDGSTVIGEGLFDGSTRAYVWTESTGALGLGDTLFPNGVINARARALSADGSVVVGNYLAPGGYSVEQSAFIWTRDAGFQDLREVLENIGVNTSEWLYLKEAWGVSADGTRIYGTGTRGRSYDNVTFVASLLEASTGVGLCEVGASNCVPLEIIARSGQLISQDNFDDRYFSFWTPQINGNGEVAFVAYSSRLSNTTGWGIFGPDGEGQTIPRVRQSDFVEGPGGIEDRLAELSHGYHFLFAEDPVLNNVGDILFLSSTTASSERGIWRNRRGSSSSEHLFQVLDGFPLSPTESPLQSCVSLQIDGASDASFSVGGGNCFSSVHGSSISSTTGTRILDPLIETGDPAPGIEGDVRFRYAYLQWANWAGNVAFWGYLEGPGVDESNDTALWATDINGSLALVMREGDPVPGLPVGTTFVRDYHGLTEHPSYNDRGQLAFWAEMAGPDPTAPHFFGLWKWSPFGSLKLLVQSGDPVPGGPQGATFSYLNEPIMNVLGDVAFRGNYGSWKISPEGEFLSLLGPGQPAPHLENAVALASYFQGETGSRDHAAGDPALSDNGSAVLDFWLEGGGVDETNDRALYHVTADGEPILVLRKGDEIEVAHEDIRIISSYDLRSAFRGGLGRSPNNARGDLAAKLDFTDGSEAVVIFVVPEPSFGLAIAFGCSLVVVLVRGKRKRPDGRRLRE